MPPIFCKPRIHSKLPGFAALLGSHLESICGVSGWGWTTMRISPKDHAAIWRHCSDPSSANLGNKYHCA